MNKAEYTIDENKNTLWATFGEQNIVYDLNKVYDLKEIQISFFKYEDNRYIPYEVYVSENGESWKAVHKGNSPMKSDDFVTVNVGNATRYIKIVVKGNTVNGWSRISEVKFYGTER